MDRRSFLESLSVLSVGAVLPTLAQAAPPERPRPVAEQAALLQTGCVRSCGLVNDYRIETDAGVTNTSQVLQASHVRNCCLLAGRPDYHGVLTNGLSNAAWVALKGIPVSRLAGTTFSHPHVIRQTDRKSVV